MITICYLVAAALLGFVCFALGYEAGAKDALSYGVLSGLKKAATVPDHQLQCLRAYFNCDHFFIEGKCVDCGFPPLQELMRK